VKLSGLRMSAPPKVAVVDIIVSFRDGLAYALIDRLHDLGIWVVVVTGFATFDTALVNAAAFLQKPFSENELVAALLQATS
jgi:ActR/RegA family two-component response regulator